MIKNLIFLFVFIFTIFYELNSKEIILVSGIIADGMKFSVCYWKNGEIVKLPGMPSGESGTSIYVNNNDVYVSGIIADGMKFTACYWKNGEVVKLPGMPSEKDKLDITIF